MSAASIAPQFGFDRYLRLDWIDLAIGIRSGRNEIKELEDELRQAGLGKEAKAKTRTKLNALVLKPRPDLSDFLDRGMRLVGQRQEDRVAFAWGASVACYPYFGKVCELSGRLFALHGDCSVHEIHRRMAEIYGDREITKRATQAVLQTQADWEVLDRTSGGKRLTPKASVKVSELKRTSWLLEACIRYSRKPLAVAELTSNPVAYPFKIETSISYALVSSDLLEVYNDGAGNQLVMLKSAIHP